MTPRNAPGSHCRLIGTASVNNQWFTSGDGSGKWVGSWQKILSHRFPDHFHGINLSLKAIGEVAGTLAIKAAYTDQSGVEVEFDLPNDQQTIWLPGRAITVEARTEAPFIYSDPPTIVPDLPERRKVFKIAYEVEPSRKGPNKQTELQKTVVALEPDGFGFSQIDIPQGAYAVSISTNALDASLINILYVTVEGGRFISQGTVADVTAVFLDPKRSTEANVIRLPSSASKLTFIGKGDGTTSNSFICTFYLRV